MTELLEQGIATSLYGESRETEDQREEFEIWFDRELQTLIIESIAKYGFSDETTEADEAWERLENSQKEKLKVGVIFGGFASWYRDTEIAHTFIQNEQHNEEFKKVRTCYESRSLSRVEANKEEEYRNNMREVFSKFIDDAKKEYRAFQEEDKTLH